MCGIAASIGRSPAGRIASLTAALAHRGPDGMGTWAAPDGSVALGHARLAIMDPLPRSDQPFHRGPLCVVYNGELYNLRELRTQLEAIGETFTTTGDTEVVAAALARWGPRAFERFDGMFALVAFDQRDRSVLTARDR